jgi:hypothetical protein
MVRQAILKARFDGVKYPGFIQLCSCHRAVTNNVQWLVLLAVKSQHFCLLLKRFQASLESCLDAVFEGAGHHKRRVSLCFIIASAAASSQRSISSIIAARRRKVSWW